MTIKAHPFAHAAQPANTANLLGNSAGAGPLFAKSRKLAKQKRK
jgi:hypothetical protein